MRLKSRMLLWNAGLWTVAAGLFGPIYAIFVEKIGGDILTAGYAYGLFSISTGVMLILIGRWEDRVKHQGKLVVLGSAIASIGFLGYLFVGTPIHLFIVQIILGVGGAISTPAWDGLYSKYLDKGKRASEWSMYEAMVYILTAIAAFVGAIIASKFGFNILFLVMFIASLIGVVIAMKID